MTGLSSLVLLAACSNQQNDMISTTSSSSVEQSQSSSSESSSTSTSSSSSQEKKVDTSAYDSIISKYQTAVANNQTDASLNSLIVTYANSQTSPASTVYTYRDLDGNGVINEKDQQWIYDPTPAFSYGLNIYLEYKNFDLTMFWQGVM